MSGRVDRWLNVCLCVALLPVWATTAQAQGGAAAAPAARPGNPTAGGGQPVRAPFVLNAQQQQRMDQILNFWQFHSGKVKTFRCAFTRWEYDPVFGPAQDAKTISDGVIRYAAPDKGEMRVDKVSVYQPPREPGGKPSHQEQSADVHEHWICDGQSIFEFSAKKKLLIETKLPPDMRGQRIADGPLPFLFGAKADQLKRRYWMRELQPPTQSKGEYWLEAYPKYPGADFSRVEVILDEKQFLPIALQLHSPNGKGRTVYQFRDRKVNDVVDNVRQFTNSFIRPKTPSGWKKVVEDFGAAPVATRPATTPAPPRTSRNPAAPAQR